MHGRTVPSFLGWFVSLVLLSACGGSSDDENQGQRFPFEYADADDGARAPDTEGDGTDGRDGGQSNEADGDSREDDAGNGATWTCSAGRMTVGGASGSPERSYRCAGGVCDGADRCASDRCGSAVALDLEELPVEMRARQPAYNQDWAPQEAVDCDIGGGPLEGVDAFFRLTGVPAESTVVFDARDSDTPLAFYVIDGCTDRRCQTTGVYDENGDNTVAWRPTDGEDVILGVKSLTEPNRQGFSFEIRRQK